MCDFVDRMNWNRLVEWWIHNMRWQVSSKTLPSSQLDTWDACPWSELKKRKPIVLCYQWSSERRPLGLGQLDCRMLWKSAKYTVALSGRRWTEWEETAESQWRMALAFVFVSIRRVSLALLVVDARMLILVLCTIHTSWSVHCAAADVEILVQLLRWAPIREANSTILLPLWVDFSIAAIVAFREPKNKSGKLLYIILLHNAILHCITNSQSIMKMRRQAVTSSKSKQLFSMASTYS